MSEVATPLHPGSSGQLLVPPAHCCRPEALSHVFTCMWALGWGCSCSWLWLYCLPVWVGSIGEAQVSVQELHYASLQRLPCGEGPDLGNRERKGSKEDPNSDYTCIYQNKTT
ncbi:leukocyte-specific transcript 1 protein isoform X2 [Rhinolophus sinicus]|uniref:leukocyte-specific transcript 1 protein isoform X2 n=1 Tax=Rhinolophus sinicus TaxID=89399 RepID=UPI003D7B054D